MSIYLINEALRYMSQEHYIFHIRRIVRAYEKSHGIDEIDPLARIILTLVAELNAERTRVIASDIVNIDGIGTPPTIYARLKVLLENGWIIDRPDPKDGRVRELRLSPKSRRMFSKISVAISKLPTSSV